MGKIVCSWCQTLNDSEADSCLACGAPIEKSAAGQVESIQNSTWQLSQAYNNPPTQDLLKAGNTAEEIYTAALGAYSLAWRTLGEALSIGVASFILGLAGGATRQAAQGILAGVILGILVGATTKNFWLTILGAPVGAVLGAGAWILPWVLGAGVRGVLYSAFVFSLLGAILGQHRLSGTKNRYERLRPWLGAAGGFLFALLGVALGLGLDWFARALAISY